MNHADTELCNLLDEVHVIRPPDAWCPIPDQIDQSQRGSDERVCIKDEQGQVFVFILLHQNRPDVAQIEHDE